MELSELNLTEDQIAAITKYVQSETDKVRTDYSTKLKTVNEELTKYKPVEKSENEKALETRIAELEAKEHEIANKEKAMTIADKLKGKGMPAQLAKYLNVGEDIDKSLDEIGAAVGSFFLSENYKPTGHASNTGVSKQDFKKMSYMQRSKLLQENPELFKALSN